MTDEATEIAQEQLKDATQDLKEKARIAGLAAWDVTKATCQEAQNKAVQYGRATDAAVRDNPYVALGFAFCIGMLIGAFATRTKVVERN